jgi:hypothetical protein
MSKKNLLSERVLPQADSTSVTEVVLVSRKRHPFARRSRGGFRTFVSLVHASSQACCSCSPTTVYVDVACFWYLVAPSQDEWDGYQSSGSLASGTAEAEDEAGIAPAGTRGSVTP